LASLGLQIAAVVLLLGFRKALFQHLSAILQEGARSLFKQIWSIGALFLVVSMEEFNTHIDVPAEKEEDLCPERS
jgi:hypothetical protein